MSGNIWEPGSTVPVGISLANRPGGIGVYDATVDSVAYLKSLVAGANVTIVDNGDGTITISAVGGGGGGSGDAQTASTTFAFTGIISPSLTGLTLLDDWNPANLGTADVIKFTSAVSGVTDITGISGGSDGRILFLINDSIRMVRLCDGNGVGAIGTSSLAANRFLFSESNNAAAIPLNLELLPGSSAFIMYDGTSSRWKLLAFFAGNQVKALSPLAITAFAEALGVFASVMKFTAKANTLKVHDIFEFKVWGHAGGTTSTAMNAQIRVNPASLGGNIYAECQFKDAVNHTHMNFEISGYLKIHAEGNAATGKALGLLNVQAGGQASASVSSQGELVTVALDTTIDQIIELVISTGNVANTWNVLGGFIRKVN